MIVLMEREGVALAAQFARVSAAVSAEIASLSDAQWRAVCRAERWPVGATAFHIADAYARNAGMIADAAMGDEYLVMADSLNALNDLAALAHTDGTRAACLDLMRRNVSYAASVVRALTPPQLASVCTLYDGWPPSSVRELVVRSLICHPGIHLESIRAVRAR